LPERKTGGLQKTSEGFHKYGEKKDGKGDIMKLKELLGSLQIDKYRKMECYCKRYKRDEMGDKCPRCEFWDEVEKMKKQLKLKKVI
jgi:lipopolysaccharide biosynthesis regulator YciM